MRYICLVAIVLALPLTVSAQQRRAAGRSDTNQAEQRRGGERSGERRSDERTSDGPRSDGHHPGAKPPLSVTPLPWWERQPAPWWEGKPAPSWENRNPPGWDTGNVARALLDQQRLQQQRAQQLRHGQLPPPGSHRRSRNYAPSVVYVLPTYGYFSESIPTTTQFVATAPGPTAPLAAEPYQPPPPPMGALRLEVEPKESLQIFVDGVYVGTPADLGDEIELAPGTRRIELRAPGHRTLTFTAEIADGRLITYRGSLESVAPSAPRTYAPPALPAPAAPAGSRVIYVIPGCYLGNVSPKNVALPAGCDVSKLTTISP
ncbi:MAG: hypothetical protein ABI024_15165 [Vicinamibacterales bacterium]